jgi:hypothetical protein
MAYPNMVIAGYQGPCRPVSVQVESQSRPVSINLLLSLHHCSDESAFSRSYKLIDTRGNSFVVEDESYNYISARYPGDAELFAEEIIKLMESFNKIE